MADFRRRALIPRGRQPIVPRFVEEEIYPSSGWSGTTDAHCLLVDLPGFKKNEISFNVEETGIISVKGRRSKGENKIEFFEKIFNVPEDGDIKRVSMELDGDTLRVRIPKLPKKEDGVAKTTAEAPSSNIEEDKDKKEEPNIPASSSTIDNKPEKTESPASTKKDEDKVQPTSPGSRSTTNGITMKEPKIPPPSIDPSSNGKKGEPALTSQPGNGKQQEPDETPKGDDPKAKPGDPSPRNEILGQGEKSSKPSVMGKIIENKSILIASLISFTLGVLLSQKFHPPHPQ